MIINLILEGASFKKKKSGQYIVLKISVLKKKIFLFLQSFINFYLPLLSSPENIYKQTIAKKIFFSVSTSLYRFNYFCFPPISELELIYEDFELIYDFVSNFKFQLDVFIKTPLKVKISGGLLLRMNRFPCIVKLTKKK